jgi:TRAP-type C4-dicarboxylate transport system substrate-binding protein
MKLPVYSRADLSRTVALVVALFLTAVPTSAVAREFRAADTQDMIKALGAEHAMSPEVLVTSRRAWESLSDEDRKIFREAAVRSSQLMRAKWKDLEERSRRHAEAAGVTIVTDLDRKPFQAAMTGIYAKAQSDPAAAELIERIRKVE